VAGDLATGLVGSAHSLLHLEQGTGNQQKKTPMFLRRSLKNNIDLMKRCHHKKKKATKKKEF